MNTSAFGVEKGTLIRVPATANLMVDSADRDGDIYPSPYDFQITRRQPLISGYFSRVGATEVVLDWCEYNVPTSWNGNDDLNRFALDISGTGGNAYHSPAGGTTFSIPPGVYTIGNCLLSIAKAINSSTATTGITASVSTSTIPGWTTLDLSGGLADFVNPFGNGGFYLGARMGFSYFPNLAVNGLSDVFFCDCPDLRLTRYLDIVCDNLTQVQDVQDATTATSDRNVIVRWYMDEDVPEPLDPYGFPILMGYTQFHRRRIYNPPKQIKWEQNLQVGNLRFTTYDDLGELMTPTEQFPRSQILMTLQLTEG